MNHREEMERPYFATNYDMLRYKLTLMLCTTKLSVEAYNT